MNLNLPGTSDEVTTGVAVHVTVAAVHDGKRVKTVVDGGRVITRVLDDVERRCVTTSSVLVNVGKVLHDDMLTARPCCYRCLSGDIEELRLL